MFAAIDVQLNTPFFNKTLFAFLLPPTNYCPFHIYPMQYQLAVTNSLKCNLFLLMHHSGKKSFHRYSFAAGLANKSFLQDTIAVFNLFSGRSCFF
jgi:hypothetical protein